MLVGNDSAKDLFCSVALVLTVGYAGPKTNNGGLYDTKRHTHAGGREIQEVAHRILCVASL